MEFLGIPDQTLLGFAGGLIASLILTVLGRGINKLVKLKPKQVGWLALILAAFAIYFTPYAQISYFLFFTGFLWIFILVKGWRLFSFVRKKKGKEEKKEIIKKESKGRRTKRSWKKTFSI
ncbi:MAG: hypothetical protein DRQ02_12685 [Candidatus Latescibacterota bacterium]|nr:MAG: hypothetical protein DRQ02_12685 [Candidatus Latescibacterota bacterium]